MTERQLNFCKVVSLPLCMASTLAALTMQGEPIAYPGMQALFSFLPVAGILAARWTGPQ
ncbi:hypothetical protein [Kineosporia babensis]|uniref:Uncharacterized protein n=1 Tax=Kineosporia babensis TaxID=499548 RepID=A0A9X1ST24_9ACTN|nr:hypothetical protein [Kineosporia babensis]MCD5310826.1 hypothetical protein [Kineosporia babensis]